MGKAVIVATTHTDLFEDLNPAVQIHKRFGKEITVNYYSNKPTKECSLVKEMRVKLGALVDWRRLAGFHYRSHRVGAVRKVFCLMRGSELCGVIVYCYPPPNCFGRRKVLPKMNIHELNRKLSVIMRVVVHPKYRTIGLGAKLVGETLSLVGTPFVEMVAVMAKYNPFAEKAGMQKIMESKPNMNLLHAIGQLQKLGFDPLMLGGINQNQRIIGHVERGKVVSILEELSGKEGMLRKRLLALSSVYPSHEEFLEKLKRASSGDLAVVLKRLAFLAQTKTYLFWRSSGNRSK
jgi:GNAT superfamily N-acetyltransferase